LIIRQKGAHKFLVATTTSIDQPTLCRPNTVALRIPLVGDTNWAAMGAPNGMADRHNLHSLQQPLQVAPMEQPCQEVGICVLTSDLTPTAGNMSISYFSNDSQETAISKLTNKFLQNFAGGATGGNADTGDVWNYAQVVNDVEFAANFFSDEGVTAKSGAEVDTWAGTSQLSTGNLDLAIVENFKT
jgi:hypothetical protein